MTLIVGFHLLERFYLVSDTRVTSQNNQIDLAIIKDNLIKAFNFNQRISAIAAGQVLPASFILNELKSRLDNESTIFDLKEIIKSELRGIISKYVNTTNCHTGRVAYIIAGYGKEKTKKKIEASLLGNAMSAHVAATGEGVQVNQSIDNRLIKALVHIGGKGKGDYIDVDEVYTSEMFSITLNVRTAEWELKYIECYQYAIFHPDQNIKTVNVPADLLSFLEFRHREQGQAASHLYEEAEMLINFVRRTTRKYGFLTVGGHIFILLQTPLGNLFPTGDFARIKQGKLVKAGRFFVDKGKLMYQLEDGVFGIYRHIESISKQYLKNKDTSQLEELIL